MKWIKMVFKLESTGRTIGWLMLGLMIPVSCSDNKIQYQIPDLVKEGDRGYLKSEFIYTLDNKPTEQCHASTIEETPSGLIAAWFGGPYEKHPDVGIWISRNSDGNWTKPVEVVNGIQDDSLQYPCWNPVLFLPDEGPLMLFYKVGPSPREWWGEMITSEDGGLSWSVRRKLGKGKLGHLLGPVKNKPVQMSDGSILCPSSTELINGDSIYWKVHFELTRDLGKNWAVIGPINEGITFDAIQPSILTYPGNRMQILCRTKQQVISQSWSEDAGMNWSGMTATSLPNPNSGTDAVTLNDGRQLLVYNHTIREGGFPSGRQMLNVAISKDGTSWSPVMTLEKSEGEYSYPAVIQSSDGMVHITYTYRRESIKHVIINPFQLAN
ncbi:MAG: exo-alpha-sialidase [Bacteroidales bacterium]|nr:exo-alpha-sialidase [Bacteroidales bacterium]